jgi:hypothetical protein
MRTYEGVMTISYHGFIAWRVVLSMALLLLLCPLLAPHPEAEAARAPNISSRLAAVLRALEADGEGETKTPGWGGFPAMVRVDPSGRVEVMIEMTESRPDFLRELQVRGSAIEIYDPAQNLVQAWVLPDRIGEVAALPHVKYIDLPNYGVTNRSGD